MLSSKLDNNLHLTVVGSDTAPDVYVTGAWANLDPHGNLVVYLYHDIPQMPSGFVINANSHGQTMQEQPDVPENTPSFVRKVVVRTTIPLREAQILGTWLADRASDGIRAVNEALAAQDQSKEPNKRTDEG